MEMSFNRRVLIYLGSLIMFAGFVVVSVGVSTPRWSVSKVFSDVFQGIFFYCSITECSTYSRSISDFKQDAMSFFTFAGMGGGALATFFIILDVLLIQCKNLSLNVFTRMAAANGILGGIFGAIAIIIWAAGYHDSDRYNYGYSFFLGVAGSVGMTLGGVMAMVFDNRPARNTQALKTRELNSI